MAMLRACLGGDRKEASKKKEVVMGTRKSGGQPGNLNVLKHGFYSKHFQNSELEDLDEARDLQEEITMMRVVIRRLLKMARGCKDMGELVTVLEALGLASTRVAGLMKTRKFIGGDEDSFDEQINSVIDEITRDWPIRKALERIPNNRDD